MLRSVNQRGFVKGREVFLLAVIAVCIVVSFYFQHKRFKSAPYRVWIFEQKIKLPPSDVLKVASLGYDNVYGNYLWLQSIQAFGSGWRTEGGKTEPIYQYFDTLTDIDPNFDPAYRFANLVIGDQRGDYNLGQEILRKGCYNLPGNYSIPYLGVYNSMWMGNKPIDGRWFAIRLQRIGQAPNFMKRMLEYIERHEGHYDAAFRMNVRYYLDYVVADNQLEKEIVMRRLQDLLDRQAREVLSDAARKYIGKNGEHPKRIEDILTPEYLPTYKAPSAARFARAKEGIEGLLEAQHFKKGDEIPEPIVEALVQQSMENVDGLPPDPFGTWYMIHEPTQQLLIEQGFVLEEKKPIPYILSAGDLLPNINRRAMDFQGFVMNYYSQNGNTLPSDEEIKQYLGRDPLGGHFVYQREAEESPIFGVFYSTAGRRISEKKEPRIGITGRGPWPFSVAPRLEDNPEDKQWGIEHGYILPDGTELWETPEEKAARLKTQAASPEPAPAGP
jgi:hypothetical protein